MMNDELAVSLREALGGAYVIERELGGGGMSRVFVAEERALSRRVVVKVLSPDLAAGLSTERFRREILLAARLQHPHIVPVLAAGEAAGSPYFTMPYVEGNSLRDRLRSSAPISIREVLRILRDVANALAYAHAQGVIHRDIKPDNVLLSHGSAVVTDFGVAKALSSARHDAGAPDARSSAVLTRLGTSLGTPMYMAPEQAAGDPDADHRVDIYSLGVLAYELLVGEPPFTGRPQHALIVAHLTETPAPLVDRRPEVAPPLAELVHRCLAKDPSERPASSAELVSALDDLMASISASGEFRTTGATSAFSAAAVREKTDSRGRKGVYAIVVLLALALVGGGAWYAARGGSTRGAIATADRTAIAVLPFANIGGDARDDYFSDGMTDELTTVLSGVPGLRVASRTSAFAFRDRNVDAREIGRALNVGALLEGRVRRDGERLRVTAQLTSAADGLTIWSETYQRDMRDVFEVQDEIARAIAAALRIRLGAEYAAAGRMAAQRTADLEAYDLYLRGRYHLNQRGDTELRRAADYFARALARDREFAAAHAGMADAMSLLPVYGATSADSAFAVALTSAERAVALDSTMVEAHTTLGLVRKSLGQWTEAEQALRRAIAIDPRHATAHQWLGELLIITDRVPESVDAMREAVRLEPMSAIIHAELTYALGLAGRMDEALPVGTRAVELAPDLWVPHAFLGHAHLFNGRVSDAVRSLERAVELDPTVTTLTGALAFAYAAAGQPDRARAVAERIDRLAQAPDGPAFGASVAWLGLGDRQRGLAWLERSAERREAWLYAMSVNAPFFDSVRGDPRFAAVVQGMGLDPQRLTRLTRR